MNIEIARKRYMDVIRPDVMHNSLGDFLATHVPMKKLYVTEHLTDQAGVPELDKKSPKTEEEVYELFMGEKEEDQFGDWRQRCREIASHPLDEYDARNPEAR